MGQDTIKLTMSDGVAVSVHRWVSETEPKALVVLSHGMAEYAKRYERLAKKLCKYGYALYAEDHRGHGETAGNEKKLGFLAEKNGFQRVVLDVRDTVARAKSDFPRKKVFLLGHSFGSFISQSFIEQFGGEIDGCILSGTAGPRLPLMFTAKILAKLNMCFFGKKHKSSFIDFLALGSNNNKISDAKTTVDWLSRDPEEVRKYTKDPFCGFKMTVSFFYDLFSGLYTIHTKRALRLIPQELPIYIFAGDGDPVGSYGKTVKKLAEIYRKNGIKEVKLKLYKDGRHEMLNEINREEVEGDLIEWLEAH